MNTPLLTVLMPVYNAEKHIAEAIESVLTQTFTDFEFIIINDGSVDNTDKIIRSYNDPRIRYYQNINNEGISYSLNKGIDLAMTGWIARMDADDICYPYRLQRQYNFLLTHSDGALFSCAVIEVDEQKRFVRKDDFHPDHFYYNLIFANWIYHSSMVYRKNCVEAVGKYRAQFAEDWDLTWHLSRRYKIYHQPEVLLKYRLSSQSLSRLTRKMENENATLEQAKRNIGFYLGKTDSLRLDVLETITNVEEAATKNHSVSHVLKCLWILRRFDKKILRKKNINRDQNAIVTAAKIKSRFILAVYSSKFNKAQTFILFILAGEWKLLFCKLIGRIKYPFELFARKKR